MPDYMPETPIRKRTMHGPGRLTLTLDRDEVFPDNPGEGTPAMVAAQGGRYTATLWCAVDTGELLGFGSGADAVLHLTPVQRGWLTARLDEANAFLYGDPATTETDDAED